MTDAGIAFIAGDRDWRGSWPVAQRLDRRCRRLLSGVASLLTLMMTATASGKTKAGEQAAVVLQRFQHTIVPHLDAAYNFARYLSRDADAAQDIAQDAFLRAYRGFEGYRGGDPRAWLFSIVRNCYHAWLQQRRRKSRLEVPWEDGGGDAAGGPALDVASETDTAETALIRDGQAQRIRAVISTLPDPMREVLVLRELEDLSYRQIAEIIEAPIGTVMSRLARARREFEAAWIAAETGGTAP